MLRITACFLITAFLFVVTATRRADSFATLTRVTNTPEHVLNLNPTISDDGRTVAFESSGDLANTGGPASFRLLRTNLSSFAEIGSTRGVCPAMTDDGRFIVFASSEDLL